jgi:2-oxoglutarate ferredoxin oxidoreductase subunit gamma
MGKTYKMCCAGFGGQGVMSLGMLFTYAGMVDGKHVTWCPSYGPEMRGGTANCVATISDEEIGSPLAGKDVNVIAIMNNASMTKFAPVLMPGGSLYVNSTLVRETTDRTDIQIYEIPASEIALEKLGNGKLANIVMVGAINEIEGIVTEDAMVEAFQKVFGKSKEKFIPINKEAMKLGMEYARSMK